MGNSKIELIFPNSFVFIYIFASISQKFHKKWVKNFFLGFSWKLPHELILTWRIQNSGSFFQISSSSSSFVLRLVKSLKKESKMSLKWVKTIFLGFSWRWPDNLILMWRIEKLNLFFQIFSSSFSFCLD